VLDEQVARGKGKRKRSPIRISRDNASVRVGRCPLIRGKIHKRDEMTSNYTTKKIGDGKKKNAEPDKNLG